jgi:hypothetical protein
MDSHRLYAVWTQLYDDRRCAIRIVQKMEKDGSQKGHICVIFLPICDYAQKVK